VPPIDRLTIDGLTFTVRLSPRRRTIGITVRHDGGLEVAAPSGCRRRHIERAVRDKLPWVRRKLAEMASRPPAPRRLWADGEMLPYLGTSYPLCLVADGGVPVRLRGGRFLMEPTAAADGRRHMVHWYEAHARPLLGRRVDHFAAAVGTSPASIEVKDLGRRWGTCHADGRLRFHWQIVLFPRAVVDYIVVHELAHLRELNHSRRFWGHVEAVLPEYRDCKAWLKDESGPFTL